MYKNATLTHREILIFSAVIVVIFVLFFAPNYAVIQKIQRDVADLTVEDAAAHLAHKYCATDDMISSCASRCQTQFSDFNNPVVLNCYRMCNNFCTCEKGIATYFWQYIDSYCSGYGNSTVADSCRSACTWAQLSNATQVPVADLSSGVE